MFRLSALGYKMKIIYCYYTNNLPSPEHNNILRIKRKNRDNSINTIIITFFFYKNNVLF